MHKFKFYNPKSLEEVLVLLDHHGDRAKLIAGGTDILIQLRNNDESLANVQFIINIDAVPSMRYITEQDGYISIGSLATHAQIASSSLIKEKVNFLSEAAGLVGSPQIRHRGTIGGNIVNASPAADTVPVLVALDAVLMLQSLSGSREVSINEVFLKPYKTSIKSNEILTEIRFKCLPEGSRTHFIKVGRRKALAIARVNLATAIKIDDQGIVEDVRIAPGSIMPTPCRAREAEKILLGSVLTKESILLACQKVSEEMIAKSGMRASTFYKKPVVEAITSRILSKYL
ncbi:MAG: xanthine dehydrogenase family protein subunit M [Bacillota bacterium]